MTDGKYKQEFWQWVENNRDSDTTRLRLNKKKTAPWIDDAISQIENERKSRKKFQAEGAVAQVLPKLMPISISVEQATSAAIATIHRELALELMPESKEILDMTCGLGVDTALLSTIPDSHIISIEKDARIAQIAKENFRTYDNIEIVNTDSVDFLTETERHFDLIYIDPARRGEIGQRVFNIHDCTPDVCKLWPLLKMKSNTIMVKLSPMIDISQTIKDLPGVRDIYIIEQGGECRELLAICSGDNTAECTIHILCDSKQFNFTRSEEDAATADYRLPQIGEILLEPSSALMKGAPFKLISQLFGISALHPNTHLYLSQNYIPDFIGRQSLITDVLTFSSGNLKRLAKQHLSADVAVRNFPMTADQLRQRLSIKKSGTERIMGITAYDGKQYILRLNDDKSF